jgi:hypothetical protein
LGIIAPSGHCSCLVSLKAIFPAKPLVSLKNAAQRDTDRPSPQALQRDE